LLPPYLEERELAVYLADIALIMLEYPEEPHSVYDAFNHVDDEDRV
jgi:hypothetical protein